ncbi:hypothetical protein NDU88_010561 [Pleurodeles waltl]|uniref:Uncharacterized protein n=1 Tax=Pleurodeles waltl TaxID=8319 RepID=A0AAV7R0X4_PLEWA|nr:hypothetical protein NDU88_010561 [Pleurodeles waltl]
MDGTVPDTVDRCASERTSNKVQTPVLMADRVVGCGPVTERQRSGVCSLVEGDPVAKVVVSRQSGKFLTRVAVWGRSGARKEEPVRGWQFGAGDHRKRHEHCVECARRFDVPVSCAQIAPATREPREKRPLRAILFSCVEPPPSSPMYCQGWTAPSLTQ